MATTIEIQNNAKLDRLLVSHPEMEKKVRKIMEKAIKEAQAIVARAAIPLSSKEGYKAVHSLVYESILGGNINLITGKKAGRRVPLPEESARKQSSQRGGNRIPRSRRTEDLLTYAGPDRSFVLRFLETGTSARTSRYGNRGSIASTRWFTNASVPAINKAAQRFDQLFDELLRKTYNEK